MRPRPVKQAALGGSCFTGRGFMLPCIRLFIFSLLRAILYNLTILFFLVVSCRRFSGSISIVQPFRFVTFQR